MPWACCLLLGVVLVGLVVGFGFVSWVSPLRGSDSDAYGGLPVALEFGLDFVEPFGDDGQDVVACAARVVGIDADDVSEVCNFLGECFEPVVDEAPLAFFFDGCGFHFLTWFVFWLSWRTRW